MPQLKQSLFTSYEFSSTELLQACILSPSCYQRIQTLACEAAEQQVRLTYEADQDIKFVQQQSYLCAQIETYRNLLDAHDTAIRELEELAKLNALS